ncbi:MAG: TIGR02147 family protein [Bacteriovoracia bacterium]
MKTAARPVPFDFKTYQEYLAALFAWFRANGTSLRSLASRLGVSVALLSSIVKGRRNLTRQHLELWAGELGWDDSERSFLEKALHFQNHPERTEKAVAYKQMTRFKKYQERSSRELVTWSYLERWWTVVIREMSHLPGFQPDVDWVRQRMLYPVAKDEIRRSLRFLQEHKLLATEGTFLRLECHGGVYKLSLSQFHAQMLEKVVDSIYRSPSSERHVLGHTFKLSEKRLGAVKLILDRALEEIAGLAAQPSEDGEVFHVALTAIPLTKRKP